MIDITFKQWGNPQWELVTSWPRVPRVGDSVSFILAESEVTGEVRKVSWVEGASAPSVKANLKVTVWI